MSEDAENKSLTVKGSTAENPFAEREGKDLTWSNVNMKLEPKGKDKEGKDILSQVWGEVPKTHITAIMGPSGMFFFKCIYCKIFHHYEFSMI